MKLPATLTVGGRVPDTCGELYQLAMVVVLDRDGGAPDSREPLWEEGGEQRHL